MSATGFGLFVCVRGDGKVPELFRLGREDFGGGRAGGRVHRCAAFVREQEHGAQILGDFEGSHAGRSPSRAAPARPRISRRFRG